MLLALKITIFILGIVVAVIFKTQTRRLVFLITYYAALLPIDAYFYFQKLLMKHQENNIPWPVKDHHFYVQHVHLPNGASNNVFERGDTTLDLTQFYVDLNQHSMFEYLSYAQYFHIFIVCLCCIIISYKCAGYYEFLLKRFSYGRV